MAAALERQADDSLLDGEHPDVASVGMEVPADRLERALDADLERIGMQPVEQEHARDERVAGEGVGALGRQLEQAHEGGAVQLERGLHQLARLRARPGIGERLDRGHQLLDPRRRAHVAAPLEPASGRVELAPGTFTEPPGMFTEPHVGEWRTSSVLAVADDTCARRTAGTDRSCARCA